MSGQYAVLAFPADAGAEARQPLSARARNPHVHWLSGVDGHAGVGVVVDCLGGCARRLYPRRPWCRAVRLGACDVVLAENCECDRCSYAARAAA